MYFFKINELKNDLIKAPLSESEVFKYLIASTIVFSLEITPFFENNIWDIYASIISGLIVVIGTIYIYRCNGGKFGKHFLQRYISLSWVLMIRLLLLILPITIIFFIILEIYSEIPENTTVYDAIFLNILYIIYFWLFGKHILQVSKGKS
ncbi:hypothetical protein KAI92_03390 [Candidatus Parcubacteria bacterium]|nr:hypothetical protein [Candidatus Parcubacteria bacterium]